LNAWSRDFDKMDPNLLQQEPCKGAETDSQAKFGKKSVVGAYRKLTGFYIMVQKLTQGVLRMLSLCSGSQQ
jgi:hypothetical protein